jgi:hypothetical protein
MADKTREFKLKLTKDELTILQYIIPDGQWGDPLKDTYELGDDEPDDPYGALDSLRPKVFSLRWTK